VALTEQPVWVGEGSGMAAKGSALAVPAGEMQPLLGMVGETVLEPLLDRQALPGVEIDLPLSVPLLR
jgi:hypothetical protein